MKYKVLIGGGLILIAAALCLTAYNLLDDHRAGLIAQQTLEQMAQAEPNPKQPKPDDDSAVSAPEPEYILDPEVEMPTVEIDGVEYIGTLEIPALELALPVASQWSDASLKLSPCRYTGSAYLNDLIIAGHNYKRHFARLGELNAGDEILFTDADDNLFSYQVSELKQLAGAAVEEMQNGDWDLTLFTCTIGGKARVTVRCVRIDDATKQEVKQ